MKAQELESHIQTRAYQLAQEARREHQRTNEEALKKARNDDPRWKTLAFLVEELGVDNHSIQTASPALRKAAEAYGYGPGPEEWPDSIREAMLLLSTALSATRPAGWKDVAKAVDDLLFDARNAKTVADLVAAIKRFVAVLP